jgi:hypothetical protein
MRDFNPRPEVRPEAFQFARATNGGSFVRSRPRSPFSDAEEIAVAQKILADSAKEKLTRKAASAALAENYAEGALAAAATKTAAAADRAAGQKSRSGTQAPGGSTCSICEQPPGSCQCRKIGQSGRWFRSGSSIIVNC